MYYKKTFYNKLDRLFCDHVWDVYIHPVTMEKISRRCKKCGLKQKTEIKWVTYD